MVNQRGEMAPGFRGNALLGVSMEPEVERMFAERAKLHQAHFIKHCRQAEILKDEDHSGQNLYRLYLEIRRVNQNKQARQAVMQPPKSDRLKAKLAKIRGQYASTTNQKS